jgi:outer membrane protein assembly factor BamB
MSRILATALLTSLLGTGVLLAQLATPTAKPAAKPGDWPQFLGPTRDGISAETGLIDEWPAGGWKPLWRKPGGVGMAGLSVSGGRLITLVQKDGQQWAVALDAKTGDRQWEAPLAPEYTNQMGDGPRAAPTIHGDRVFVFTGEGILTALKLADGQPLWSHNTLKELGGKEAEYGMACSPLVAGQNVVVTVGAPKATVAAYDLESGKRAWTAGSEDPAGYSSPALLDVAGQRQLVVFSGGSVLGIEPKAGKVLWRHPYETDFACNIATPIGFKGQVFVSSGENHGSVLLSPQPSAAAWTVKEVWQSQGAESVLRTEWQTSILLDGHLYGFDNVGSAGPVTHLTCIEAATGERVWQKPRFGKGNLIAADGKLLISTMTGELVIVRATPTAYEELGRGKLLDSTRQAPALAGGLLYLRDDKEIVCVDLRK